MLGFISGRSLVELQGFSDSAEHASNRWWSAHHILILGGANDEGDMSAPELSTS